jgi:hypothetical protein
MKLRWDQIGEKYYETGDKEAVFYKQAADGTYPVGEAWSGITGFTESPEGADTTDLWADDQKYLSIRATETYGFTITAYAFPVSFMECDGTAIPVAGVLLGQQARKAFGFVIKTTVGNDIDFNDHAYKLHLVYGATVNPSSRDYSTVNDSPEAVEFSWDGTTTPVNVPGFKPISCITIDSRTADPIALATLEEKLFGKDGTISYSGTAYDVYRVPVEEGWFERSGSEGSYVYTLSEDTEYSDQKTYYRQTGATTYTAVTGSQLYINPSALGLYERTGSSTNYVYTKSYDTIANLTKTYVQQIETGGSTAYLPLPAEVLSTMGYTG